MWKIETIGDVLSVIQNGVNCKQNKSGEGLKITRIETIADTNINYDKTGFSNLNESQKQKAALKKGDILFSHINSPIHVGKTAIYDGREPLYHGINLLRLQTIEAVDSNYFNFFLQSLFWFGYWIRTAKQSVNQASVNQADIKKIPFSYPPLKQQKQIVKKLDATFAEIDKNIENLKNKIEQVESLIDRVLEEELKNVEGENVKLGDVIKKAETVNPKSIYLTETFDYIDVSSVNKDKLTIEVTQTLQGIDAPSRARRKVQEEDIIFATIRPTLKRVALVPPELDGQICSTGFIVLRSKKEVLLPKYLLNWMTSKSVMNTMKSLQTGASYPAVTEKQVKNINIQIPLIEKQKEIVKRLDAVNLEKDISINALNNQIKNYIALKSSILSRELEGKMTA